MTASPSATLAREELPGGGRHFVALDGLRCFAVLQVLLNHYVQNTRPSSGAAVVIASNFFHFLGNGVHLFFVISGFLITGILLRAKSSPTYFRTFYARRTLRIFPLYYGVLFLVLGGLALYQATGHVLSPDATDALHAQWWLWLYLTNFSVGLGIHSHNFGPFVFGHFWTLAVEEQFYLVWPLIVLMLNRTALKALCIVACVALLIARLMWNDNAYLLSNDGLFVGAWLAAANVRTASLEARRRGVVIFVVSAATFLALTTADFAIKANAFPAAGAKLVHAVWPAIGTVQAIMFAALVYLTVTAQDCSLLRRSLEARPAVYIGKISYGIYVYHLLLIGVFMWVADQCVPLISTRAAWVWPAKVATATALALLTAAISWKCFEQPVLRLKNRFQYRTATRSTSLQP